MTDPTDASSGTPPTISSAGSGAEVVPFKWIADEEALADLKRRLQNTRFVEDATEPGWTQGPPTDKFRALIDYWRTTYDWRKTEADLNQWPQFKTKIGGLGIHFIHVRSRHPGAQPLLLTHGWPSTVLLFKDVIAPLTDPTAHGGEVQDAFDVVIPSLPGFGLSDKPTELGWTADRIAQAWGELMPRLGYDHYFAQGGDWGAFITTRMAQQHAPGLDAVHLDFIRVIPDEVHPPLLPDQQIAVDALEYFRSELSAYSSLMSTKPQLVGHMLGDSPVAQAALLYDMANMNTGMTGDPESVLGIDAILDEITFYWLTNTSASSARLYHAHKHYMNKHGSFGNIELPVGGSVFPAEAPTSRTWASEFYPQLFYWNEVERGGHYAARDEPILFTNEMRQFARAFRSR